MAAWHQLIEHSDHWCVSRHKIPLVHQSVNAASVDLCCPGSWYNNETFAALEIIPIVIIMQLCSGITRGRVLIVQENYHFTGIELQENF